MLQFWSFFLGLLSVVNILGRSYLVCAQETPGGDCHTLLHRREWRTLKDSEKADYITAVKCLQSRPAQKPLIKAARTRFDEFQALHIYLADNIHIVGQFLPWHRRFLHIYEGVLRNECGYKGAQPYWDWSLDADASRPLLESPVFDPVTGFGGTGVPDPGFVNKFFIPSSFVGCVQDGPFASYVIRLGPGKLITDHCLVRGVNDTYKQFFTSSAVANTTKLPTFELFRIELEGKPITPTFEMHDGGHLAVGGEMSNFYSSLADPIFYLHHANLDRIWWNWQQVDPDRRLYDVSGRSSTTPPYQNITLDFGLDMGSFAPTKPIREVMDIYSEPMCYTYAKHSSAEGSGL
ncbi:Di-copper centre-containing protein [Phlegmacium glaucopus]|nr:Di-copper centre-containing protein [Phlegmacium glaucopus]